MSLAQTEEPFLSIYPNPFADSVTYQINATYGDSVELRLFDLNGRLLLNLDKQPYFRSQTVTLSTESLNNGIYLTSVSLDSTTHNNRIIKDGGTTTTFKLQITVSSLASDELILYPNPTNSELAITLKSTASQINFSLHDLDGKTLLEKNIENESGIINWQLNLSELANGVYIMRTKSTNGELSQRLIKK